MTRGQSFYEAAHKSSFPCSAEGADQMSFDVGVGLVSVVNSVLERTETTMRVEHEREMVKVR